MTGRPASPDDIDAICRALPLVELGSSWGDRPTYKVMSTPKGRGFVLYRKPSGTAIDPASGEPFTDLIVITVPDADTKAALVEDPATPFFTVPHFDERNSVLVQLSRLGELGRDRLEEILTEAWAAVAPKDAVDAYFAGRPAPD